MIQRNLLLVVIFLNAFGSHAFASSRIPELMRVLPKSASTGCTVGLSKIAVTSAETLTVGFDRELQKIEKKFKLDLGRFSWSPQAQNYKSAMPLGEPRITSRSVSPIYSWTTRIASDANESQREWTRASLTIDVPLPHKIPKMRISFSFRRHQSKFVYEIREATRGTDNPWTAARSAGTARESESKKLSLIKSAIESELLQHYIQAMREGGDKRHDSLIRGDFSTMAKTEIVVSRPRFKTVSFAFTSDPSPATVRFFEVLTREVGFHEQTTKEMFEKKFAIAQSSDGLQTYLDEHGVFPEFINGDSSGPERYYVQKVLTALIGKDRFDSTSLQTLKAQVKIQVSGWNADLRRAWRTGDNL